MRRFNGFGVGQQGYHPRARDGLSAGPRRHKKQEWGMQETQMTEHFFVPSFSIRRHLHRGEEAYWTDASRQIGHLLGRQFEVAEPKDLTVKTIEQKALIHRIRQTGEQPTADMMRDLVFNIRDGLTSVLADAPDPIEVGLGKLAVFGRNQNKLGFTIDGWKGWRARYDDYDQLGQMSSLGALLVESQVAIGNIATAFPDMNLAVTDIANSPHVTIARTREKIHDYDLRKIQARIDKLDLDDVALFGDPVINYKLASNQDSQTLHIRHAWQSLAPMPADYEESFIDTFQVA
jgi:hypothetical protein